MSKLSYTSDEILELGLREAFYNDKSAAETSGLKFDLSFANYAALATSPCHSCDSTGTIPVTTRKKRNSVDRINRLLHFTTANTITACTYCKAARKKVNWQDAQRLAWIYDSIISLEKKKYPRSKPESVWMKLHVKPRVKK